MESILKNINFISDSILQFIVESSNEFLDKVVGVDWDKRQYESKMELSEFLTIYSFRIKKVVDSCTNELQLNCAEQYIRNGINAMVRNPDNIITNEYVRIQIAPRRQELEIF